MYKFPPYYILLKLMNSRQNWLSILALSFLFIILSKFLNIPKPNFLSGKLKIMIPIRQLEHRVEYVPTCPTGQVTLCTALLAQTSVAILTLIHQSWLRIKEKRVHFKNLACLKFLF